MKIAELSGVTGVSIPSIKYYVREGLLPAGDVTVPKQADYDDRHVRRLRLVRALRDVGQLGIGEIRDVLAAVDGDGSLHDAFGVGQDAMVAMPRIEPSTDAVALVDELIARHELRVRPEARVRALLAAAVTTLTEFGWPADLDWFDAAMAEARDRAAAELAMVPTDIDRAEQVEYTVLGTVAIETMLNAIRRLALEDASARRFG